ncbi:hypothetical protein EAI_04872 [Harpegnathos saltator]|uniref:Uncharacterized protein n=1 Tax=Harpegnathos saltator TaxID=610380 RepID=E2BXN3_HARSA|nr:hypothetical protein EAI_04872 [Harpegnathos saltator]
MGRLRKEPRPVPESVRIVPAITLDPPHYEFLKFDSGFIDNDLKNHGYIEPDANPLNIGSGYSWWHSRDRGCRGKKEVTQEEEEEEEEEERRSSGGSLSILSNESSVIGFPELKDCARGKKSLRSMDWTRGIGLTSVLLFCLGVGGATLEEFGKDINVVRPTTSPLDS